ncbi:MAG: hypothetical protein LBQ67_01510 [Treponema sp.]|jgi:hypothetical protein|nr:hypothetical protein [Treponema sp.]
MSKQFESIIEGLNELSDYCGGDKTKARVLVIEAPDISIAPLNTFRRFLPAFGNLTTRRHILDATWRLE